MAQGVAKGKIISDLDTMHLSTDCSLSERDDKIAQADADDELLSR